MATPRRNAEELFEVALELTPQERTAFLDRECRDSPALRNLVEQLLLKDQRAGSFLEKPIFKLNGNPAEVDVGFKIDSASALRNGIGQTYYSRFKPGDILDKRFIIVRFIARGGMGEVYEVEDRLLPTDHIALKVILPQSSTDHESQHRFEQEILLARKVAHPNLCPIYDIFHCEEPAPPFSFLTMRLLPGENLAARLARAWPLPREEVKSVFKQMNGGLAAIHGAGIIHRDIKPNNVMIDGDGSNARVWITDFGLARLHEPEGTLLSKKTLSGTLGYLAPELLLGQPPSQASDIFALGVVLHEVLTGEKPAVDAKNLTATASAYLKSGNVPPDFAQLVCEFIATEPRRRSIAFEHAQHLLLSKPSIGSVTYPAPAFWTRRRFTLTAAAGIVAATGGGLRWKWDKVSDFFHPLPAKRFVALLHWPPSADLGLKPMLLGVIDAISNELARAEAFDRNLLVIAPQRIAADLATVAQLNAARESLGANLVLAASGITQANQIHLFLRVLAPPSTTPLRSKTLRVPASRQETLLERAVQAAADLLDITAYKPDAQRSKVGTENSEAFAAFQAAESLRKEENDTGLDAAIEKYKQAIDIDSHYARAHARLAWAYLRFYGLHREPAALTLASLNCKAAIQLDPALADAHLGLASVYRQKGEDENSSREMSKALALDPSNAHTLIYQADFYAANNRWDDAEEIFNRVLSLRPNYWLGHNEWGAVLEDQGKYPRALQEFRLASLAAPKNAFALKNVGSVYRRLGKLPEALEALNTSFAMKQDDQTAANLAEVFRVERKYPEAIEYAQRAAKLNPNEPSYWLELGDVYSSAGKVRPEGEAAYRRATIAQEKELQTSPKDGPCWMRLALCNAKTGKIEEALTFIAKAESLHADDIDSQLFKARILELAGKHSDALTVIARCLNRGPTLFQLQSMPDLEMLRASPDFKRIVTSASFVTPTSV